MFVKLKSLKFGLGGNKEDWFGESARVKYNLVGISYCQLTGILGE